MTTDLSLANINDSILKLCFSNKKLLEQAKAVKIQIKFDKEILSTTLTSIEKEVKDYCFFDIETQLLSHDVGGWDHIDKMKVAIVVIYSSKDEKFYTYTEDKILDCVERLKKADLVVSFNGKNFDIIVLRPYTDFDLTTLPHFDILEVAAKKLGFRVSLQNFAENTLGEGKNGDGVNAVALFKENKIEEIKKYCQKDVEITRDLYYYSRENGYLKYADKKSGEIRMVEIECQE